MLKTMLKKLIATLILSAASMPALAQNECLKEMEILLDVKSDIIHLYRTFTESNRIAIDNTAWCAEEFTMFGDRNELDKCLKCTIGILHGDVDGVGAFCKEGVREEYIGWVTGFVSADRQLVNHHNNVLKLVEECGGSR